MNKENIELYNKMRQVFLDNAKPDSIYDVDMYCSDLCKSLFVETDPQDIVEDDYLVLQEALILLVRDDSLLDWFGLSGLCIIYTEMSSNGEHYYVNKENTESVIRTAIEQAANNVLYDLQSRLGITSGDYSPDVAIHLQEHLSALVKDYCAILNDQKLNV